MASQTHSSDNLRLPHDRGTRRTHLSQRRTDLPARCARPGLLSRNDLHPPQPGIPRDAGTHRPRRLGFNCLRIHIKVEDPRYYEVADRLGLLIWTEIPNWVLLTDLPPNARPRQTFHGMVERDGHHPSIIAWTLINENWGTDLTRNAEHRRWLADFYHYRQADRPHPPDRRQLGLRRQCPRGERPGRFSTTTGHPRSRSTSGTSGWPNLPDAAAAGSGTPTFRHERRADLPLIVSEFGNWGLPNPDTLKEHGAEPWWFETGFEWGDGIVYPHGVRPPLRQPAGWPRSFHPMREFIADIAGAHGAQPAL